MIGGILPAGSARQLVRRELSSEFETLSQWIFETIRVYLKGRIIEIGSGTGKLAECFVSNNIPLHISDPNGNNCRLLLNKFKNQQAIKDIHQIKLMHEDFEVKYAELLAQFDTVIIINTIDHLPNEQQAFSNAKKLLRVGGHFIVLLPAKTALFNESQYGLREWKKQNRMNLQEMLGKDLESVKTQYFNVVSIIRWLLSRYKTRTETLEKKAENEYDRLVPVFRTNDEIVFHRLGLSIIAIREKVYREFKQINHFK